MAYPGAMPDLFKGEMLIAFGRYGGKGPASVKVSGTLNGERREFVTDVRFATKKDRHARSVELRRGSADAETTGDDQRGDDGREREPVPAERRQAVSGEEREKPADGERG